MSACSGELAGPEYGQPEPLDDSLTRRSHLVVPIPNRVRQLLVLPGECSRVPMLAGGTEREVVGLRRNGGHQEEVGVVLHSVDLVAERRQLPRRPDGIEVPEQDGLCDRYRSCSAEGFSHLTALTL